MERKRRREQREALINEDKEDLRKQLGISFWEFFWMVALMLALYLKLDTTAILVCVAILLVSTLGLYIKFKDFYEMRDRGQRTLCITIAMYASLILTLVCAYYFVQDEEITFDYAAIFGFGWFFFTFTLYKNFARYMVVGNKRQRSRS